MKKKWICTILVCVLLTSWVPIGAVAVEESETQGFLQNISHPDSNAMEIYSIESLRSELSANPDGSFVLMEDLDFSEYGQSWEMIDEFNGILDGQGHVIRNFTMSTSGENTTGLIRLLNKATILNLGITIDPNVPISVLNEKATNEYNNSRTSYIGTIAATSIDAAFVNCFVIGDIQSRARCNTYIGGFVGGFQSGDLSFEDCYYRGNISAHTLSERRGAASCGGFVGSYWFELTEGLTIENCLAEGTISTTADDELHPTIGYAGGFLGSKHGDGRYEDTTTVSILESSSLVDVSAKWAGGMIGNCNQVVLSESNYSGRIVAQNTGGGLVGTCKSLTVENCQSDPVIELATTYTVLGTGTTRKAGGVAGSCDSAEITDTAIGGKISIDSSKWTIIGGLLGSSNHSMISDCDVYTDILDTGNARSNIGGFVGWFEGDEGVFEHSSYYGDVVTIEKSILRYGGFVGEAFLPGTLDAQSISFEDCTVAGQAEISGDNITAGGLVGRCGLHTAIEVIGTNYYAPAYCNQGETTVCVGAWDGTPTDIDDAICGYEVPAIISEIPIKNNARVLPNTDYSLSLTMTFDRPVDELQGFLQLIEYETDQIAATVSLKVYAQIDAQNPTIVTVNTKSHTVKPGMRYYVRMDSGAVCDAEDSGVKFSGIQCKYAWNFTVVDMPMLDDLLTEEDLFLYYPEFLSVDPRLTGINQIYTEISREIPEKMLFAHLFYALSHVTTNVFEAIDESCSLDDTIARDAMKDVLMDVSNVQDYSSELVVEFAENACKALTEFFDLDSNSEDISEMTFRKFTDYFLRNNHVPSQISESITTELLDAWEVELERARLLSESLDVAEKGFVAARLFVEYLCAHEISIIYLDTLIDALDEGDAIRDAAIQVRKDYLEKSASGYIIRNFLESENPVVSWAADVMPGILELFGDGKDPVVVEMLFSLSLKGANLIYEMLGGVSVEDILGSYEYLAIYGRLHWMIQERKEAFQALRAEKKDITEFRILYNIYFSSAKKAGQSLEKFVTPRLKGKMESALNRFEDVDGCAYDLYLEYCLAQARGHIGQLKSNLTYIVENEKAYITGYSEPVEELSAYRRRTAIQQLPTAVDEKLWLMIPSAVDGYPVAGIADDAFRNDDELIAVYVEPALEFVGDGAFSNCGALETVYFMNGTAAIGANAFSENPAMTTFDIPEETLVVKSGAFSHCSNLQEVFVKNKETIFENESFLSSNRVILIGKEESTAQMFAPGAGLNFEEETSIPEAIYISRQPDVLTCIEGEEVDTTGMVLDVVYSDGRSVSITEGWQAICNTNVAGEQQVLILYGSCRTEYAVTVLNPPSVIGSQSSTGTECDSGSSTKNPSNETLPFIDVADKFWAKDEIEWAYENGYMLGKSAEKFEPNYAVTRQQVWMILARFNGIGFADFSEAKNWAITNNISDGLNPGTSISRQQLVTMLYRYVSNVQDDVFFEKSDLERFADYTEVADYAREAVAWAVAHEIIQGTSDGRLNPGGTATRAHFATILHRVTSLCGETA